MPSHTITEVITLTTETCCSCGLLFAMTEEFVKEARRDHRMFYCPSGHQQYYTAKSDKEKLTEERRRVASLQEEVRIARVETTIAREQRDALTKRIEKGVCPHCRRHFVNVQRHVATKHPQDVTA